MRRIDALLTEYSASHRHPINKLVHWIFVPLIFFSTVGLLWSIPCPWDANRFINWATLAMVPVAVYYVMLSASLTVGMLIWMAVFAVGADLLDTGVDAPLWLISMVIFVVSWIFQFLGHKVEGRSPSFLRNMQFLLIGPVWLMHFVYRRLGIPY